jgi:hypothetical protein
VRPKLHSTYYPKSTTTIMPPAVQASSSKLKTKSTQVKDKAAKKPAPDTATDIDSIFSKPAKPKSKVDVVPSGKGKEKAHAGASDKSSKPAAGLGSSDPAKKKKKAKMVEADIGSTTIVKPDTTRVVEVVDTSIPKVKEVVEPAKTKKRDKKAAEEDEMFADSRGTGPSTSMTKWTLIWADEGFLIYKEAELDIDPEAGGTDLCPFDCECCKSIPRSSATRITRATLTCIGF